MTSTLVNYLILAFGFGFVIFFHELGHFLAAKWVGIKVEQFAVGFGQAAVSWRKGIGFRVGSTQKEFRRRVDQYIDSKKTTELQFKEVVGEPTDAQIRAAASALDLGETEYRLNWIPLGGYVKMMGQDDLKANAGQSDPRAFNMKSIRSRMLVVAAGVVMNVILAAIGFMILFRIGFHVPPPVVGSVLPNSPAAQAGIRPGDRIVRYDGKPQFDFTEIAMNVVLSADKAAVPVDIQRPDGKEETVHLTPLTPEGDPRGFLSIGITQTPELRGLDDTIAPRTEFLKLESSHMVLDEDLVVRPGDTIAQVDGKPVDFRDYYILDEALQASNGTPVPVAIKSEDGSLRTAAVTPHFMLPFGRQELDFAGMEPRARVDSIAEGMPAIGQVQPGDVITGITISNGQDHLPNPTAQVAREWINRAGDNGQLVKLDLLRNGKEIETAPLATTWDHGRHIIGVGLQYPDESNPVIATVLPDSPAAAAKIPLGSRITQINGQPVQSWFDVRRLLLAANSENPITIVAEKDGRSATYLLTLTSVAVSDLKGMLLTHDLLLHDRADIRQTKNLFEAARWGMYETRDFIQQFYLTLLRMFQGTVSHSNMMGPLGIFASGAQFANKGIDWLLYYLSMISANLAVVNFLPIPIVDGGLFMFLIIEKLQGKPLSPTAQQVAQLVGLVLILGVFLLATYQDIARFMGRV